MTSQPRKSLLSFLVLISATCPASAVASKSPVAEFTANLKRQFSESKLKSLAVDDFTDSSARTTPEGIYFADLVNSYLSEPPKKFELVDRHDAEKAHVLHNGRIPDALAYGTIEDTPQEIVLRVFVKRTADQALVADQQIKIQQSAFYGSLGSYPNRLTPSEVFRVGEKGIEPPQCEDCPAPQFHGPADGKTEKSQSVMILLGLVITAEGRVANVRVLQGAGPEFEDRAWQAMRVFRFKPARNKAGQDVAAAIPMEVSFTTIVDY